ncbi:hypothetical protein Tco_0337872, partial [Tanacetum coccineum]
MLKRSLISPRPGPMCSLSLSPKASEVVRVSPPIQQVVEETVATADATKCLDASESAEE